MKKSILVTGTGSGIGLSIVQYFSQFDYHIYANVHDKSQLDLFKNMKNVSPVVFDVRNPSEISKCISEIIKNGELDAIINNAGISYWSPIVDVPDDIFHNVMETNLFGVHNVTRAFLPFLNKTDAKIINISSYSAKLIFPFMGPYHISKAAIEAYSDSLRRELRLINNKNIKVVVVEPGSVDTRLWQNALKTTIFPQSSIFYKTAIDVGHGVIHQELKGVVPPILIAKKIKNILDKKNPKIRYIVSPQSLIFKILLLVPDFLIDHFIYFSTKKFKKSI